MTEDRQLVFVYGTSRKGGENHAALSEAECIAEAAWTSGSLYDTGMGYPALYPDGQDKVYGELYSVDDKQLARLDYLEGYQIGKDDESEYLRVTKTVHMETESVEAFVYVYNRPLADHMQYLTGGQWADCSPGNHQQDGEATVYRKRRVILRILLVSVFVFCLFSVLAPWAGILQLPSLDLLTKSRELANDEQISSWMDTVVTVKTRGSKGTGFNIAAEGIVITNYHVIDDDASITVTYNDGRVFRGDVIAEYPDIDLAIVQMKGRNLPHVKLFADYQLSIDERVIIIGNPLGLSQIVMEATMRGYTQLDGWEKPVYVIEGPVLKGSSGSPVFNDSGQVVGVVFASAGTVERNGTEVIIGLAIPIEYLLEQEFFDSMSKFVEIGDILVEAGEKF